MIVRLGAIREELEGAECDHDRGDAHEEFGQGHRQHQIQAGNHGNLKNADVVLEQVLRMVDDMDEEIEGHHPGCVEKEQMVAQRWLSAIEQAEDDPERHDLDGLRNEQRQDAKTRVHGTMMKITQHQGCENAPLGDQPVAKERESRRGAFRPAT